MSLQMLGPFNSGIAIGGAGVATNSADHVISESGELVGIYVRYNGLTPPATTDVTIKTIGNNMPSYNLLVLTNANTDGLFLVGKTLVDATGAALTFDGTHGAIGRIPFSDGLNVKIAQANNVNSVDIWLFYR